MTGAASSPDFHEGPETGQVAVSSHELSNAQAENTSGGPAYHTSSTSAAADELDLPEAGLDGLDSHVDSSCLSAFGNEYMHKRLYLAYQ